MPRSKSEFAAECPRVEARWQRVLSPEAGSEEAKERQLLMESGPLSRPSRPMLESISKSGGSTSE
jgi:hypothetical protein